MSCSWDHIRSQVRQFRTNLQNAYPTQVLTILKDFTIHNKILYLLSNNQDPSEWSPTRHMQLYQVQLEQCTNKCIGKQFTIDTNPSFTCSGPAAE